MSTPQPHQEYIDSICMYDKQFREAWSKALLVDFAFPYKNISDVIIAGMGGSAFGGHIVKCVFSKDKILIPVEVVSGYDLPAYADERTLVICTSYSGNTEETLSIFKQAKSQGCKIVTLCGGGKLATLSKETQIPGVVFEDKFNPSKAPRTGLGYIIGGTMGLLHNLNLIDFSEKEAQAIIKFIGSFSTIMLKENKVPTQIAQKLLGNIPVFVSSEHIDGAVHVWRNFLNETAKNFAINFEIPEMNHHMLEGLMNPKEVRSKYAFIFVVSNFYNERNRRRIQITRDVVRKNHILDMAITLSAENKFEQVWETIIIGSFVSYHLAKMHGVNPSTNEYVDYLKAHL